MTSARRRRRVWTSADGVLAVISSGIAGQKISEISQNLQTTLGIAQLSGFTVGRTHLCVQAKGAANNTVITQQRVFLGLGVFPQAMDEGDFPDLETYQGDYFGYECMTFQGSGTANKPVEPESAGFLRADYRSMRKIPNGEAIFLVIQQTGADDYDFNFVASMLLMMP